MTPAQRARARRGEGDQLRSDILEAAEALLVETASEDAVSIRAVADAVGVTPPSIYRHFPDKTTLLLEVCHHSFERFAEAMAQAGLADDGDPVERLRVLARSYVQFGLEHPEHYRLMYMDRYELTAEQYAEEMLTEGSSYHVLLVTVRAMLDAGVVRADIAAKGEEHVGLMLWAAVHGLTSLFVAKPSMPWPDKNQLVDDLVDMTLRGVLA